MNLSKDRMLTLMAYADGELEGAALAEVETFIAKDEEAARFVADVGGLGTLVREGSDQRTADFQITDAVMASIDASAPDNIRSLAARRKRAPVLAWGLGALAAAAAMGLFMANRGPSEAPIAGGAVVEPPSAPSPPSAVAAQGSGIEVEAVESAGSAVSVFYLPGASELSTSVVVWIDEKGEK